MREMPHRMLQPLVAVMTVVALVVTACGDGDDASDSAAVANTDTGLVGGLESDPAAGPNAGFDGLAAESAARTAVTALEFFGDLPTAGVAVLSAYDRGFTFDQIVEAVAAGTLTRDGAIDRAEPEEAEAAFQPVGFRALPRELDIGLLTEAIVQAQEGIVPERFKDHREFFLRLILLAVRDGYPADMIVEAIVFGGFTDATAAEVMARDRALRRAELQDDLEYCSMRGAMAQISSASVAFDQCVLELTGRSADELDELDELDDGADPDVGDASGETEDPVPPGSGGLGPNGVIPGPDGSMTRESITLAVEGDQATLTFDLAFSTAVDYVDEEPVCFDKFTFTSGASNLVVDGSRVTGSTEFILNFDGATSCPQSGQDDLGVPQAVGIDGDINGTTFTGAMSIEGVDIPFTAAVSVTS